MNKLEFVKALIEAGLRPEDLMDEYTHAEAAAKEKRDAQIKEARTAAAKAMLDYVKVVDPDIPLGEADVKLLEDTLIEVEKAIMTTRVLKTREEKNEEDKITKFLAGMGW